MFLMALVLGLVGLIAMAVLGLSHGGHHGQHSSHGHDLHTHGHHTHSSHAHGTSDQGAISRLLSFVSPRAIFSLALGFGAIGMTVSFLPPILAILVAGAGAILFERLLVEPYWNAMFKFASTPAKNLESVKGATATANTNFDANGQGLIELELDGQVRQVLGTLQDKTTSVTRGQQVRIEVVNNNGSCIVSKI
jgi:uncharacterized membrane protein YraQ (UPF0718 family)